MHVRPFGQAAFPADALVWAIDAVRERAGCGWPAAIDAPEGASNAVAVLRYADGRALVVKRGRYAWDAPRFAAARAAARLLARTPLRVPAPLDLPEPPDGLPIEAYWRIDLPVLREAWPALSAPSRTRVLRSWGAALAAVHAIPVDRFGPLAGDASETGTLGNRIGADLEHRLLPASHAEWPEGAAWVARLAELAPGAAARAGRPVLAHGDPHAANVLCGGGKGERAECAGFLDLETAEGGVPEADVARLQVLHGPLFGAPLPEGALAQIRIGYGRPLDARMLSLYRAVHLANLGYHAASTGLSAHAADVARALRREVRALERRLLPRAPGPAPALIPNPGSSSASDERRKSQTDPGGGMRLESGAGRRGRSGAGISPNALRGPRELGTHLR